MFMSRSPVEMSSQIAMKDKDPIGWDVADILEKEERGDGRQESAVPQNELAFRNLDPTAELIVLETRAPT